MVYTKHTNIPIYDCYFSIILGTSWEKIGKRCKPLQEVIRMWYADSDIPFAHCLEGYRMVKGVKRKCIYVIFNIWDRDDKITPGTICHESVHVKNYIWEQIKHVQDQKQDEPEAYLVDYIVTLVDGFIRKVEGQIRKDYDNESITEGTKAN